MGGERTVGGAGSEENGPCSNKMSKRNAGEEGREAQMRELSAAESIPNVGA